MVASLGERPSVSLDYFPNDFLPHHRREPRDRATDPCDVRGDRSRKTSLVEYGLPPAAALDNRPLKFEEFDDLTTPHPLYQRDARRI